jgi:hypothetical protein
MFKVLLLHVNRKFTALFLGLFALAILSNRLLSFQQFSIRPRSAAAYRAPLERGTGNGGIRLPWTLASKEAVGLEQARGKILSWSALPQPTRAANDYPLDHFPIPFSYIFQSVLNL